MTLPTGEFVRMAASRVRRKTDFPQQPPDALASFGAVADAVHDQWLLDGPPDRRARVEGCVRVLLRLISERCIEVQQ